MGTELHWPRRATFVERSAEGEDSEERRFIGPGTFEVPDAMVERYLERGWERPEASEGTDAPPAPATGSETEADADAVPPEPEGFDPEGFISESWQAVVAAIEDGEADGHLDAVREAEQNRDGDPRSSVIEAVEQRAG